MWLRNVIEITCNRYSILFSSKHRRLDLKIYNLYDNDSINKDNFLICAVVTTLIEMLGFLIILRAREHFSFSTKTLQSTCNEVVSFWGTASRKYGKFFCLQTVVFQPILTIFIQNCQHITILRCAFIPFYQNMKILKIFYDVITYELCCLLDALKYGPFENTSSDI